MKKADNTTLTPKLRFPEFRDALGWKERTLSDVLSEHRGKSTGVEQVFSVSVHKGIINQVEHLGRSFSAASTDHYSRVLPGDVVYTKSPTGSFPFGIIKQSKLDDSVIVSPLYGVFSPETTAMGTMLDAYFESPANAKIYLEPLVQKGAKNTINIKNDRFLSGTLTLPLDTAEQQKIADFLTSVDELIAAHGRKLAALRDHKKGLMQQLSPQEGKTQPRLRFPEFRGAGEWKEKSLGQLVDMQSGGTPSKANPAFWNGSIPWVSAKDMKRLFLEDAKDHISEAAVDNGAKLVPAGTLLILVRGMTLLKDVPICVLRLEMSFNQDVKALRPKDDVDGLFLAWMMMSNKQRLLEMVSIAGHGTGKLDTDELKKTVLMVPHSEEQQRIADCLSALDCQIDAQAQKMDTLRKHKKGLMQQLFPSPEDEA